MTKPAGPKGIKYGVPGWVYLIGRSLMEPAGPKGIKYGVPGWVCITEAPLFQTETETGAGKEEYHIEKDRKRQLWLSE